MIYYVCFFQYSACKTEVIGRTAPQLHSVCMNSVILTDHLLAAWVPAGMSKGAPVEKCFLLQMLSKTSVDEVFMHHFEKMSSASGGSAPDPHRGAARGPCWGTSVLQTPSLPTPRKNPAGAHVWLSTE